MRRYRTLVVLAVLAVAAAAAAVLVQREDAGIAQSGEKLFPDLLERLGDVTRVEATHAGETVTLALADDSWSVTGHYGYPAETAEVRGLLVGAAELVRVEPKTANAEHYTRLELEDPADEDAESFGYVMKDAGGESIAGVVVGKRRFVHTTPGVDEYFVRVAGDPRVWLVSGRIPRNRQAVDWLRREVTDIDQIRVRRAAVTHPDGTVVEVSKSSPKDTDFTLQRIPEGHELDETFAVHSIGTALAKFTLNDVAPVEEVDFGAGGIEAVAETFDGVRLTMRTGTLGERTLIRMDAEFDPALVTAAEGEEIEAPLLDEAAARAEAEALRRRWQGWAYEVPEYTLNNLRKTVEDLVKPMEEETEEPSTDSDPVFPSG